MLDVYKEIDRFKRLPLPEDIPIILKNQMDPYLDGHAVAPSIKHFRTNFNSLTSHSFINENMKWDNVIMAGGCISAALLPRPTMRTLSQIKEFGDDYRKKLSYYYTKIGPAAGTDVDLFLYGLSPSEAEEKIAYLHRTFSTSWKQPLLAVRTQNAITFVPQWPKRKVQIILRLYQSPAEILAGFDIDSCAVAYDGTTVWANRRV